MARTSTRRVALVTGAAQGIGLAIALRLADDGLDVAVNDLAAKQQELEAAVKAIEDKGRRAAALTGNVTVEDDVRVMVEKVVASLGRLDVMVANAGVGYVSNIVDVEPDALDKTFAVNVKGVALCYKYAARQMIKQGEGGRLLGASSLGGKLGAPAMSAYSASKFAVRGLSQAAALELKQYNITVNTYAPGWINTPGMGEDALRAMKQKQIPGRWKFASVDVVASVVSYLASEEAHHITGDYAFVTATSV